jgi:pilus assembly protein CpaB
MGRRTVLMLVAILVAALGSALVFLYVQGINDRAIANQQPVEVLTATDTIQPGESITDAQAAGKLALTSIPRADVLPEALTSTEALQGQLALTTIYPGEQILPAKFGANANQSTLTIPKGMFGISVQLSDSDRVAGFVQPGSHVAIFVCAKTAKKGKAQIEDGTCKGVRMLLSDVEVIGVGDTSILQTTSTDSTGTQQTDQVPTTILTIAVSQGDVQRVKLADANGDLSFALMTESTEADKANPGTYSYNVFGK